MLPMKRALIVAYHFPPCAGSSGLLRSLKFCRYLPEFGWQTAVLTLHPRNYESLDSKRNASDFEGVPVTRAFALDTKKHLSFRGAYFDWMALPDRWVTWLLGAIPSGLRAIRKHRAEVIFSTFPVSTAILIGFVLHRITGKPWVVDLRDSMTEENYPPDKRERGVRRWIEREAVRHASRIIFTANSTRQMYLDRYPDLAPEKCLVISNGYDEADFSGLNLTKPEPIRLDRPVRLLHTGIMYPQERDPRPFFRAIARLKSEKRFDASNLHISFRAPGSEELYKQIIEELGISDIVELQPYVTYLQSLQECADADGLLLFQAANCDHQIPAKAYEYLRIGRPILALTSRTGDTAALLKETGGATILNIAAEEDIYRSLPDFLDALRAAKHALADPEKVRRFARRNQAAELAECLNDVTAGSSALAAEKAQSFAH
jgi:glycosyltransferase involved in cell wall biosynthesis